MSSHSIAPFKALDCIFFYVSVAHNAMCGLGKYSKVGVKRWREIGKKIGAAYQMMHHRAATVYQE